MTEIPQFSDDIFARVDKGSLEVARDESETAGAEDSRFPPIDIYATAAEPPQRARSRARAIIPTPERASRFQSLADWAEKPLPERAFHVPGLVPSKQVTMLSGDGGTGKSLLALQLAHATVAGKAWIGRSVRPGSAIFLSAEDDDEELYRRSFDICRANGVMVRDMPGLTIRSLAGEDALLAIETEGGLMPSPLFAELEARAADEAPELIVIDTLADVFPGNENDRGAVRQFIGLLRGLAIRQSCAVLLLAHPSLAGINSGSGTSGSTAWNNSVRSRLYLTRVKDDGGFEIDVDRRTLTSMKANYGPTGTEIGVTWRDGVFVPDGEETGLDRMAANAKAERVFLKLLRLFNAQGRHVSPAPSVTYAPAVFGKHPEAEGVTRRALASAMETHLRDGTVVIAEHGRGMSTRQHLEVAK